MCAVLEVVCAVLWVCCYCLRRVSNVVANIYLVKIFLIEDFIFFSQ